MLISSAYKSVGFKRNVNIRRFNKQEIAKKIRLALAEMNLPPRLVKGFRNNARVLR